MSTQHHIYHEEYFFAIDRWMEINIYPSPSGLTIYFRDITESKKAEEEARKVRESYKLLVDRITDAFFSVDENWCYTYVNKQAGELVHRNPADIIGKSVWTEFPSLVGSETYKACQLAMSEQRYVFSTDYYPPLDIWYEINIYPSKDGLSVFIRDITSKMKAEEEILQTQMRLTQAQEIAHLGHWEINFEKNTSKWSDEAYKIYGLTPGDHNLSEHDWFSFVHPEDRECVNQKIAESRASLGHTSFDHRIVRKDGSIRYIHSESKYEFNSEGRPIGLYGIAHDLTEWKKLEDQLLKQQKNEQLKITAVALQAREKERNAIGIELHDNVNQILVGTKLMLSMTTMPGENVKEIVLDCMDNLQDAINENRKIAHNLVTPDFILSKFSDQFARLTDSMLKTISIDAHIDTKEFQEDKLNDQQKLTTYRIAQEQYTNIVKYSKADSVNILLSTADSAFKMIISDNGIGMDGHGKAIGIGLNNIKGRMAVLDGNVEIKTAPDQGFTLEINMPL
jgi:two-component system sensor histidine kinase UhpB